MNISRIAKYALALTIITGAALLFSKLYLAYESDSDKENNSPTKNIESFEFLGCSGSYSDELGTRVWRTESKDKTKFLVKHQEACGNNIGSNPRAYIDGTTIEFDYDLRNDTGFLVFCECEYWATFELKSNPENIKKIRVNGINAQLMSDLSEPKQND